MTVILPRPPSPDPNDGGVSLELQMQRDLTEWMIEPRKMWLILTPVRKMSDGAGGYLTAPLPSRPPQEFRLIAMSDSQKPTVTDDGVEREIDLTLLGKWDAQVDIGDTWRDGEGLNYQVVEMVPYNGYEVRALVVKSGHG